jgi:hypothetical protein
MSLEVAPPKIAVWYHCRLVGGKNVDSGASIDPAWGLALFNEQITTLGQSGLLRSARETFICVNGDAELAWNYDRLLPRYFKGVVNLVDNGKDAKSLLSTVSKLQNWLPGHEDWLILFFHSKGATHPNDPFMDRWRGCMTTNLIAHWRQCVMDLNSGNYDAVGVHWTHNSPQDQNARDWGANSYFAGCFWWATAHYLLTLPKVPEKPHNRHQWFKPELLLGCGKPRILDYHEGSVMVHV